MADSLLGRRDRFICITHIWPLGEKMLTLVLEDIKLINERDNPPTNYEVLSQTVDTYEKGTAKKLICTKMIERQTGMKCICDIIFLYRSKRPPPFYTLIGEIHGLQMCIKEGIVPPFRSPPSIPQVQSNIYPNPMNNRLSSASHQQQSYQTLDYSSLNTLSKKSDEKELLDGVPFQVNPKYLKTTNNQRSENDLSGLDSYRILSIYEIEQNFNYDFSTERSLISY